jgi:hypothetical protein
VTYQVSCKITTTILLKTKSTLIWIHPLYMTTSRYGIVTDTSKPGHDNYICNYPIS